MLLLHAHARQGPAAWGTGLSPAAGSWLASVNMSYNVETSYYHVGYSLSQEDVPESNVARAPLAEVEWLPPVDADVIHGGRLVRVCEDVVTV